MSPSLTKSREPDDDLVHDHLIQFYQDGQPALAEEVTNFLLDGYRQGDALLVIATSERCSDFARSLEQSGVAPDAAVREGRLLFADAAQTLRRFMLDGQPDWYRFQRTAGALIREVRPQRDHRGLRAYGEMVGLLWRDRQFSAAVRLEQFWNQFMAAHSFELFCAYPIDLFGKDFNAITLNPLFCAHTHLVPASRNGDLYRSLDRAVTEVLGPNAPTIEDMIHEEPRPSWPLLPEAETSILWLRTNLPERADEILSRAREYYRGSLSKN